MSNLENDLVDQTDDETTDLPKDASADTLRVLEAVLFASDELLTTARLKIILPDAPDAREIGGMVEKINRQLQNERHPFEIVEIGGGYQFKTVAYYHPWVRQIFREKASKRLSIQALECLSIIAYRQPLSKAEIEAIRGVISDGAMKTLLEKRLITITGRSEKPGRPLLYGTTTEFLQYFGLNKISDLPRIEEFEAMIREKMESMGIDELKNVQDRALQDPAVGDEATIEIALPSDAAGPPPAAPPAEEDIGFFEAAAQESAPVPSGDAAFPTPVMEAETVRQPAVRDDRESVEKPVVTVRRKRRPRKVKVDAAPSDAEAPSGKTTRADAEEAVFETADAANEARPAPVAQPDPAEDAVFEVAVEQKRDAEPAERPAQPDDDAVFEVKM
ncbi:MAG: SMC-Scp complex subunit ScpB [Chitinispirillaceae bacterium]|nr:SMC-Scp complex subunit ScpB [Chitinispirillaceae bacterium]